jgi:hypothetical protein
MTRVALILIAALAAEVCFSLPYNAEALAWVRARQTPDGVQFGAPAAEEEDTTGRRMTWCHTFSPDARQWARSTDAGPLRSAVESISAPPDWKGTSLPLAVPVGSLLAH